MFIRFSSYKNKETRKYNWHLVINKYKYLNKTKKNMKILHIEDKDFFIKEVSNFFKSNKEIHIKDGIKYNTEEIKNPNRSKLRGIRHG